MLAGEDSEVEKRLSQYGESLGMAFQLTDDLLDYTSDSSVLGKPVLKDLEEGNVTLPIITLLQKADRSDRRFITDVVESRNFNADNKQKILELVESYGTLDESREKARGYASSALSSLETFPQSPYSDTLRELPDLVINRRK